MRPTLCPAPLLRAGALALALAGPLLAADPAPPTLRLWPGKAPGEQAPVGPERFVQPANGQASDITRLTNVSDPVLAVFPAPRERATGTAVIVAPGGGYSILAWDHEGVEVARRFNEAGVTAFVLKYRVPRRAHDPETKLPLMDAQRAVSMVRHRAAEWGVDPRRIGFLGFSAGGHLAANVSINPEPRAYETVDEADRASARPDFAVLIYPGGLLERGEGQPLRAGLRPSAGTPPTFVAVAADDRGSVDGSVRYWQALKEAGVRSELHVYASGGHGFGLRPRAGAAATWPDRCVEWMRTVGVLPGAAR